MTLSPTPKNTSMMGAEHSLWEIACPNFIPHLHPILQELLNEAASQYSIQQQAHGLLQICSEENPVDEVEAERIILLAGNNNI